MPITQEEPEIAPKYNNPNPMKRFLSGEADDPQKKLYEKPTKIIISC